SVQTNYVRSEVGGMQQSSAIASSQSFLPAVRSVTGCWYDWIRSSFIRPIVFLNELNAFLKVSNIEEFSPAVRILDTAEDAADEMADQTSP
ncbi:MAG: hypothetical protein EZS28_050690, partial [Streblomastix strix]